MNRTKTATRRWKDAGWKIEHTKGGRLKLTHRRASGVIHTSTNPHDWRWEKEVEAMMRRKMRAWIQGV